MTITTFLVLSSFTQAPTAALAEGPSGFQSPPIDTITYDEPGDGRLWVRGANYKASFGAEGATFIPFLGSDASRNYPATFQLDRVTLGGEAIPLGPSERTRAHDAVTLDRGAVAERYDIALESIEQSFVFETLPGAGELVLDLGVTTSLEAVRDGAGWRFVGPEGGFDYGGATAIDAAGRSLALESDWDRDRLVFRVPADFVASATLPLVVDPVISTGTVADLSSNERSADVAYDPSWGKYMVSVEYVFSGTDSDVRVYEVSGTSPGTLGTNGVWIDTTSTPWRRPRIACRNIGNAFMIVATVGTGASRYVGGRIRDVDVTVTNPPFVVSGTLTDSFNPDVGGDGRTGAFSGEPGFVVVWEKAWVPGVDHDIYMRSYNREGQPLTQPSIVEAAIGQYLSEPVISKSAGRVAPYEFMVAWVNRVNASSRIIQARRVSIVGTLVGPFFNVTTSGFSTFPEVSAISTQTVPGQSERASVVVYTYAANALAESEVRAVVCSGSNAHPATSLKEAEGSAFGLPQHSPCVSCDGDQWVIAYAERHPTFAGDFDLYMTTANLVGNGLGLSERKQALATLSSPEEDPRIASKWAAGGAAAPNGRDESFVVYTDDLGGNDAIKGGHVSTTPSIVCGAQYCEASLNSSHRRGWLAAYGDPSTTSTKVLQAGHITPHVVGYFLVSATTNYVPNVAGSDGNLCLGGTGFGRYLNSAAATGPDGRLVLVVDPTRIPQANGTVAAASGQTWYFQCWHRDVVGGASTSNMTNAVAVPFL